MNYRQGASTRTRSLTSSKHADKPIVFAGEHRKLPSYTSEMMQDCGLTRYRAETDVKAWNPHKTLTKNETKLTQIQ